MINHKYMNNNNKIKIKINYNNKIFSKIPNLKILVNNNNNNSYNKFLYNKVKSYLTLN